MIGLALAAALVLTVAGCDADEPSAPSPEAQPAPSPSISPSPSIPATGEAQPIAPDAQPQPLPVLATAAGSRPGTEVTVHELRQSSEDTVRVIFTVSNRGPGRWVYLNRFGEPGFVSHTALTDVGGVYLLDEAGSRKYLVLRDSSDECVCSQNTPASLHEGRQFTAFAEFPAPPDTVTAVTVVVPQFVPLEDVPIST